MRARFFARSLGVVGVMSLSSLLAATLACDIFAVRCNDDDDCPNDVPFCVDDICVNEEEAERRGRDVDEEEEDDGICDDDSECEGGLCYDVDDESGFTGSCVPGDDVEDCAAEVGSAPRAAAGASSSRPKWTQPRSRPSSSARRFSR